MRVKLNKPILEYDGSKIYTDPPINTKIFDVRQAIINAINFNGQDKPLIAEEKAKIYDISTRIYEKNEMDLSVDDLAFIKDKALYAHLPVVYGRLCDEIDPKSK